MAKKGRPYQDHILGCGVFSTEIVVFIRQNMLKYETRSDVLSIKIR